LSYRISDETLEGMGEEKFSSFFGVCARLFAETTYVDTVFLYDIGK
jgi:hypothetical protein